ncbi:putative transcription factor WD40-like family [Helianthus debilis subsp. tardiflorus]
MGNLLASGGDDNVVYIWEASRMNSAQFVYRFTNHVAAVKALAWCPYNFEVLASGGGTNDGCIKLWDTQQETYINSVNTEAQSEDWSLRKAAAEALEKLAVVERDLLLEFKSEGLKTSEAKKFHKVKVVGDS